MKLLLAVLLLAVQAPEKHRGLAEPTRDIAIQQEGPLVIPASVVAWGASGIMAGFLGLLGIIWNRHNAEINEIKAGLGATVHETTYETNRQEMRNSVIALHAKVEHQYDQLNQKVEHQYDQLNQKIDVNHRTIMEILLKK